MSAGLMRGLSSEATVKYADQLARLNSEALSFIPRPRLMEYAERGQVLIASENGEPAGFLIFGVGWPQMRIYQACIQYDARRRHHGLTLVAAVIEQAIRGGCSDVRLWCADDLDSNDFWREAGFAYKGSRRGGRRRGRKHNLWSFEISKPPLLILTDAPALQSEVAA